MSFDMPSASPRGWPRATARTRTGASREPPRKAATPVKSLRDDYTARVTALVREGKSYKDAMDIVLDGQKGVAESGAQPPDRG